MQIRSAVRNDQSVCQQSRVRLPCCHLSVIFQKKRYIRVNIYIMLLVLHVLFTYILDADGMAKSFSIILAMTAAD